jgi:hypothetical protein
MAYSKAFREGLEDAVAKARWRVVTHLKSHLTPHPEDSPATRGELSKMLVVLHDCIENFITEVVGYLEPEVARPKAGGGAAAAKPAAKGRPKPKARARSASGRKAVAAKRRRR